MTRMTVSADLQGRLSDAWRFAVGTGRAYLDLGAEPGEH